jgi:HEPN domain-containing protein
LAAAASAGGGVNNPNLAEDYRRRAIGRRKAVALLIGEGLYADAVRESQEAAELALKSLIRQAGHPVPMVHEVSGKLQEIHADLTAAAAGRLDRLCEISKVLRRDRELAFYGSEDITPSEFYVREDAERVLRP